MSDTLQIIGQEQYEKLTSGIPESLMKIISQIDQINSKNLSLKGLNDSVSEVQKTNIQLANTYSTIVEAQQRAASASQSFQQNRRLEIAGAKEAIAIQKEADKQTKELTNDYGLLSKAYNEAALRAKNYALQLGVNNKTTKEAVADAKKLGDVLKALDASVGQNQRNVGNYAGALSGLQFSIRNLVSELPNLGISLRTFGQSISNNITPLVDSIKNIIAQNRILKAEGKQTTSVLSQLSQGFFSLNTFVSLAIIAGLKFIDWISKTKKELDEIKTAQDALNKAFKESSVVDAAKNVNELRINVKLAKDGILDKQKVLHQYNDTIGKTTGQVSSLDEAERELTQNGDAYVKVTLYKAAANLALEEAAKQALLAEQNRRKADKEFAQTGDALGGAIVRGLALDPNDPNQKTLIQQGKNLEGNLQKERKNAAIKAADDQNKALLDIANKFQKDAAEIAKNSGFDFFGGTEDEKKKRKKAETDQVNEILAAQKRLSDAQRDAKIEELNRTISANQAIFDDDRNSIDKRSEAYAEMYVSRLLLAQINRDKELQDVQNWFTLYQSEVDKSNATEESKRTEHQKALLVDYEAYTTRKIAIDNKYSADVQEINTKANKDLVASLVNEDIIKKQIGEQGTKDAARFQKQIEDANSKRIKSGLKEEKDAAKEREKYLQASLNFINSISDAYSFYTKNTLESLDVRSQKLKDNLQNEIDAINASTASEQEKQDKIREAQNRTAVEQKRIDDDERKAKIRQAVLEKAITISQIILNTALSVSKLLATPPLAIAAGIAGATQLAIAVATPIPQYMKGTDYHKGGLAIVGDGGEPELIREPNKKPYWSPDTDTLVNLPTGTSVTPLKDVINYGLLSSINGGSKANQMDISALRKDINSLGGIIKDKKEVHINIDRYGMRIMEKQANARTKYLGRIYNR